MLINKIKSVGILNREIVNLLISTALYLIFEISWQPLELFLDNEIADLKARTARLKTQGTQFGTPFRLPIWVGKIFCRPEIFP